MEPLLKMTYEALYAKIIARRMQSNIRSYLATLYIYSRN